MNNLVFAIVEVTYNKTKNVTSLPNMSFAIQNSMTMPGDCLWDYMTNTRYGAGIPASEIKDA
jgi:1-deoxy-D-xylulose 5-phosphate reductoisomerase